MRTMKLSLKGFKEHIIKATSECKEAHSKHKCKQVNGGDYLGLGVPWLDTIEWP